MKTLSLTNEELKLLIETCHAVAVSGQKVRLLAAIMVKLEQADLAKNA